MAYRTSIYVHDYNYDPHNNWLTHYPEDLLIEEDPVTKGHQAFEYYLI